MKLVPIMAVITAVAMFTVASPAEARKGHTPKQHHVVKHHYKHHVATRHVAQARTVVADKSSVVTRYCDDNIHVCEEPTNNTTAQVAVQRGRHHASTPRHKNTASRRTCAGCIVVSTAANIDITVYAAYASKFQALIADLVRQGHHPRFITCYALGHKAGSNHAWGGACDIDQTGWGRTSKFMYHADGSIKANGLFSGCRFRDCGHVEAMTGLHNHPPNLYASVVKHQTAKAYQP